MFDFAHWHPHLVFANSFCCWNLCFGGTYNFVRNILWAICGRHTREALLITAFKCNRQYSCGPDTSNRKQCSWISVAFFFSRFSFCVRLGELNRKRWQWHKKIEMEPCSHRIQLLFIQFVFLVFCFCLVVVIVSINSRFCIRFSCFAITREYYLFQGNFESRFDD